jgi:hypothetical protein
MIGQTDDEQIRAYLLLEIKRLQSALKQIAGECSAAKGIDGHYSAVRSIAEITREALRER